MPKLKFFDLKARKTFMTDDFTVSRNKKGMRMAKTIAPSGTKSVRILGK